MRLHLTGRHYVYNEETLKTIEEISKSFVSSAETIKSRPALSLSIIISYNSLMASEMKSRVAEVASKLMKSGIKVDLRDKSTTAGLKFYQSLFMKEFERGDVYSLFDIDQFPVYTSENINNLEAIAKRIIFENSLYCNGSRDVPVVLGVNMRPNNLRVIHELILSNAAPGKFVANAPGWKIRPSQSYRDFGDCTSGFYFVNPGHKDYEKFRREIEKNKALFSKPGFSIEYFASIWAAINSKITTAYVHSLKNPFYVKISECEEEEKTKIFIGVATSDLLRTSIGTNLRDSLRDRKLLTERLLKFFNEDEIKTVMNVVSSVL